MRLSDTQTMRLACALIFVLSLAVGALASAAEASLTWAAPTQRTDGTALSPSEIAGFEARCESFTPTGGTAATCAIAGASVTGTTATLSGTVPATGGSACFSVRTRDTGGLYSAWSNPACRTFAANPPGPPTNVTVAVVIAMDHAPVYSVSSAGKLSTLMGFIPVGRACGDVVLFTYRGSAFREVSRADVKMWGSTSLRLAAPCA